ncbi:MAG: hypothetical protein BWY84_00508 [Candidatus Aerophobetes bacterium ADurb.Bin490]|nr:MAG: hypothetical protein BWY84_00508 [Candidatus Aerophobetes bacterium ADurb.Bin490]
MYCFSLPSFNRVSYTNAESVPERRANAAAIKVSAAQNMIKLEEREYIRSPAGNNNAAVIIALLLPKASAKYPVGISNISIAMLNIA